MNHGIVTDTRSGDVPDAGDRPYVSGDLIIVTHPHLYDAHLVARIEGTPTKATCGLTYWSSYRGEWSSDAPKRRRLNAIIGRIADGNPARTAARLSSAEGELTASRRRAEQSYRRTVQGLAA